MTVYVIIDIKILDPRIYAEYVRRVPPIVKKFGGRYLARGGEITTVEGIWHPERVIILEFDSAEKVKEWFTSAEYNEVASLRQNSTITNAIMIESGALPQVNSG